MKKTLKTTSFKLHAAAFLMTALLILPSAALLTSCSKTEDDSYAKVEKEGEKITVHAEVSSDKRDVFLFGLQAWEKPEAINDLEPLAKAKVKNREAKASFKTEDYDLDELICRGYIFGMENSDKDGYEPVSDIFYITNPKYIHKNADKIDESAPAGNIKGLVGTVSQLMETGAKKTVVTLDVGKLLRGKGGDGALSFIWNGVTCHVDRVELETIDKLMRDFGAADIDVYLRIVQTKAYNELDPEIKNLAFEGASGAEGYALNMISRDGSTRAEGLINFISERYEDEEFGTLAGYIVGKDVNSFGKNYASGLDTETAIKNYVSAVRTAYNLMLAHNPRGRVYISLGNNWTVAEPSGISASEMLTTFANLAENGGDFFWQVATDANASDASNSAIWNDPLASESSPQFISAMNLTVLSKMLSGPAYLCNGLQRNILVSNFAVGGREDDKQAASYAYAFYKCLELGKIDGLIYGVAADSPADALGAGLYTSSEASVPKLKKIGTVFEAIDNKKTVDVAFISGLLGDKWNKLYEKYSEAALRRRVFKDSDTPDHSADELGVVADFSKGNTFGFCGLAASYTELRYSDSWGRPVMYAALTPAFAGDGAGVISDSVKLKDLKDAGYLTVTAMVNSSSDNTAFAIRLSGFDKNGMEVAYEASSDVRIGEWIDMYYDISEFVDDIESEELTLSIMVKSTAPDAQVKGLWISKVTTEAPEEPPFPWWIVWTLVGVIAAGAIVAFVIWFNKNYTFVRDPD